MESKVKSSNRGFFKLLVVFKPERIFILSENISFKNKCVTKHITVFKKYDLHCLFFIIGKRKKRIKGSKSWPFLKLLLKRRTSLNLLYLHRITGCRISKGGYTDKKL